MPTRDDFRFVLLPWEHRGAQFDARPDFVATAQVGGTERLFLLKAKRNILFFREVDKGDEFLCALQAPISTASLSEPELRAWLEQNANLVLQWWKGEVAEETYARVFLDDDFHISLIGTAIVFFGRDGRGWLREPWDESGLEFGWKCDSSQQEPLLDWAPKTFPSGWTVLIENRKLERLFEGRQMPDDAIAPRRLEWVCGSREELEKLMRWIAHSEAELWQSEPMWRFRFECENEQHRASLSFCRCGNKHQQPTPRLQALSDLALDFNTPTGIHWEFCDGSSGKPPIRGSWDPTGPTVEIDIQEPSFHEQLEARLLLRDWLRDKATPEQIETWLHP